jgi:cytochrome b subunit of formate dehydrogenase
MHDLPIEVVRDFRGSFHGLAGAAGDRRVANCASCHGYHDIQPSISPLSRIYPANLGTTCGECHPGAGDRFAQGGVHHITRAIGHRLVGWVRSMYAGMIAAVIGLMLLHNGLDFYRRWRDLRRPRQQLSESGAGKEILRFTVNERIQHWVLATSFLTLAGSGFALRFGWRLPWLDGQLQQTARAGIHRGAAVIFIGLALYHLAYLVFTKRGHEMARAILPRLRRAGDLACCVASCYRIGPPSISDWHEMVTTLKYNLGVSSERPAYGRFTYWEKMEYWALAWGTIVMAATGIVLWFETPFLNLFPYWAFELLRTVHLYEAALAVLAILAWHFYYVIINPDVFPLNRAMTRGTLNYDEMLREHPLDTDMISRRKDHE